VTDAECHPGRPHRVQRDIGLGHRGGERLLTEDVLAGLGGRHDLLRVEAVRGAQQHRVDAGVAERLAQIGRDGQTPFVGPLPARRLGIHPEDRAEPLAAGQQADDVAAPPAQTDDGDVQQRFLQVLGVDVVPSRVSRRA
jgi:hypothetical protein